MKKGSFKTILILDVALFLLSSQGRGAPGLRGGETYPDRRITAPHRNLLSTGKWVEGLPILVRRDQWQGGTAGPTGKALIYDDKSDPKEAVSLIEKVITVDKADLLLEAIPERPAPQSCPLPRSTRWSTSRWAGI